MLLLVFIIYTTTKSLVGKSVIYNTTFYALHHRVFDLADYVKWKLVSRVGRNYSSCQDRSEGIWRDCWEEKAQVNEQKRRLNK